MTAAEPDPAVLASAVAAIERQLAAAPGRLGVAGICGAQGSGKSTLAAALKDRFDERGVAVASLSLDDLYLTAAERRDLACDVHPLLATRGVPGTHDVGLGLATLAALDRGEAAPLPRFAKDRDDRLPCGEWDMAPRDCRLLLFEGWCVGATPQAPAELVAPVNRLERDEDPAAIWRRFANDALAGPYRRLFARIDVLVLLAAPGFDVVFDWRLQQERALAAKVGPDAPGLMDAMQIARFIQHYERLTAHILATMPAYADLVLPIGADRRLRTGAAPR